ncbi:MAG: VOC family protein, partial [Ginsengibacter sp.]
MKKLNGDKAFSGFSVNDIQKAKQFYGETLSLDVRDGMMGLLELYLQADSKIIIYPKPNHTPASFTILNFMAENIEETVKWMKEKGVVFESYGEPMKTDED